MQDYTLARKLISKVRSKQPRPIPYNYVSKKTCYQRVSGKVILTSLQEEKRFMSLVKKDSATTDCWIWQGAVSAYGYGIYRGKPAHHFLLVNKPNTKAKEMACHHCDNRLCVNPSHIYVGNGLTNAQDRDRRKNFLGEHRHENFLARSTLLE